MEKRGINKAELSKISGVSTSFLSDLTNGKGNPSLMTMEKISIAFDVPLPLLLESTDLDKASLAALGGEGHTMGLPPGFERVSVVLPERQAYAVKKMADEIRHKIKLD